MSLFKTRGYLIKHHQIQTFKLKKLELIFFLKKTHFYYAQVQGQLALTGLPWCDFCVYLSDSNEMCVDRIHFNSDYWENELLPKLKNFFSIMHFHLLLGKQRELKAVQEPMKN
ncbi:unnamed protein product [Porites lobata]|uniref:Uncharacterized protein n=1 Tax=Porites lobata TaxID=104759 RepID=A0ABN8S508_9CNID|nr:unnamed protein product [Porites lobata]